jgi:hypothetical protein
MKMPTLTVIAVAFFTGFTEQTHAQSTATLESEIVQLKATVTTLQATVGALQKQSSATQVTDTAQSTSVAQLKSQMASVLSSNVWALNPFLTIDLAAENGVTGPNLVFHGVNLHVVSGSGNSEDNYNPTGLGNIIIGYNESSADFGPLDRRGIHNLIVGRYHNFTNLAWCGIVSGEGNTLNGLEQVIAGGSENIADTTVSVIIGGHGNATIYGGHFKGSSSSQVIVGGEFNNLSGLDSILFGGNGNTVYANYSAVTGSILLNP